jgi:hypothetical protein
MRINISGKGVHRREIPGIEKLRDLPSHWYAFTNLELIEAGSMPRQIDIVIVLDDRIIIADLKDWRGKITSDGDRWFQNDRSVDTSPVKKILENTRIMKGLLSGYLSKLAAKNGTKFNSWEVPLIEGCVILTGQCNFDGIAKLEQPRVFQIDEFCRIVQNSRERSSRFAEVRWIDRSNPLTASESKWRSCLASFFGTNGSYFRPLEKRYGDYRVISDKTHEHPKELYNEYDVEEVAASRSFGLLRLWDFSKADARYASEEGRSEIAGREQDVITYLIDRQPDLETVLIRPKIADPDKGIHYWEVFERRRQLRRLNEFIAAHASELSPTARLDLARVLLSQMAAMHRLGAAHLDIGSHSVWLELPSSVRLSHLVAASYPELKSLGDRRYEFLADGIPLPEDMIGGALDHYRKDVFLLAVAVHTILFGEPPRPKDAGDPPDWSIDIDSSDEFEALHSWFAKSLDHAADQRFANAQEMLDAFNEVTKAKGVDTGALERLQRFRKWKSMLDLNRMFPVSEVLQETDRVVAWRSEIGGTSCLVKTWRRSSWGDERVEATRLARFCEAAQDLIITEVPGIVRIMDVGYLGDHLVLVQEYVAAPNLTDDIRANGATWQAAFLTMNFVTALAKLVSGLHNSGHAHGDLKPSNILIKTEENCKVPVLIDILDFAPADEGEIRTTAYAPPYGAGARERDRFAVLKIAEEIFAEAELEVAIRASLAAAIRTCLDEPPKLATLDPLIEVIEKILNPPPTASTKTLILRIMGASPGPMRRDEGRYYVGVRSATWITITGASEELSLSLDSTGRVQMGRRQPLEQTKIALAEKHAATLLFDEIIIEPGAVNDFQALDKLLQSPQVMSRLRATLKPISAESTEEESVESALEKGADMDVEELSPPIAIDVLALWRTLIDVEQEQFTEAVAENNSFYSKDRRRHFVAILGRKGTIDFAPEDKVIVEFAHKSKGWIPIGLLDLDLTQEDILAVDASNYRADQGGQLCSEGAELRFRSLMETDSRSRRDAATSKILSRQSAIPNLIEYFNPTNSLEPTTASDSITVDSIRERYGLNPSQAEAFVNLWSKRPLGLLQGPPGTGKTKFIGAIVHYALSSGMVRNVLLASQSHEAVNNATESVLKLFRKEGEEPSLIRIGQEGNVSDALKPYHSDKVETHYREQFRAGLKQRFRVAGRQIGLPDKFTDDFFFLEATIWPVFDHLQTLLAKNQSTEDNSESQQRVSGLLETLNRLGQQISELGPSAELDWTVSDAYDSLVEQLAKHHEVNNIDQIRRLRAVAVIARDWMGTVSSRRRSFEEFLANTRQIVCGTCVGLGRSSLGLASARFDLVIVDEAARCTPSELAVPLQAGRWVLLVGDQLQLEPFHNPVVTSETQRRLGIPKREIMRSDFDRTFSSTYGKAVGEILRTQYRMLPSIGRVVSEVFYEGRLQHGRTEPKIPAECLPAVLKRELVWIRTDILGEQAFESQPGGAGTSLCNLLEANAIIDVLYRLDEHQPFLEWLTKQPEDEKPIGIICTYAEQRELIRRKLFSVGISGTLRNACKIDTVDSYQGKENIIVILSLVRNNADGRIEAGRKTIKQGFMMHGNRINVALSRAMDRLVIVGASECWPQQSPMARVSEAVTALEGEGVAEFINASELTLESTLSDAKRVSQKRSLDKKKPMEKAS